ncbi:MAG: hypothetical protein HY730_08970 [Candidatus Tectomicrobia bacterium]|uniref:DUF2281 domain-containing protein n=1 Tax=Tectimicrobiota bacterium TaxID=2528274 RepID=A0A933LQT6_UNCTE|nr:hypothetical protein [Candidatus Tectomicrobia bacterium]
MSESAMLSKVIKELNLIPEHKLSEIYDFIHYFRIGLQKSKGNVEQTMKFAGCWEDMPENLFNEFLEDIKQSRASAFSRRRNDEARSG